MPKASRGFQVFVKPIGPVCNMRCRYCYYLEKERLYPDGESFRMPHDLLEAYIVQHIDASPDEVIRFSWHGGEPTLLGLDYFRTIVELQRKHRPSGRPIANGIQTNGTLLNDAWCSFLAAEGFAVGPEPGRTAGTARPLPPRQGRDGPPFFRPCEGMNG
jgi:uncharacterized protein